MLNQILDRYTGRRLFAGDAVGIDVGTTATKVVHLRRGHDGVSLVGVDLLPPLVLPDPDAAPSMPAPLRLLGPLRARQAAIAVSSRAAMVKLLVVPATPDKAEEMDFAELLGVPAGTRYRIGRTVLDRDSKTDSHVLLAAVPENQAQWAAGLLPSGLPVPAAIEVSGLASLTCFLCGPGRQGRDEAVMAVDFGAETTTLAVFCRARPAVVRQFAVGSESILRHIRKELNVDDETAHGILEDGSIDVRPAIRATLDSFLRQAQISSDFAERRYNSRVQKLYVTGGFSSNTDWRSEMKAVLGLAPEPWVPWATAAVAPGAIPESAASQEHRFAAAAGAAFGVLEPT
jgi:Tfp pilus assembly PilM family ATPase